MPQGGRAPPKKGAGSQGRSQHTNPDSNTDEKSWQRSSGGFSGAAKKEYLKWKRQQKAARRADSSDDDDAVSKQQTQQPQRKPASSTQQPTSAQQQHDRQKQRTAPSAADAAVPLRYRPLAAVPAAPFVMPAHMADTSASPTTSAAAPGSGLAAAGAPSAADGSSGGSSCGSSGRNTATVMHSAEDKAAGVTYMPRVDLAEVGFTPEGFTLTMPTRPKWQGIASTAEQLHALEEADFAAWQDTLAAQAHQLAAAAGDSSPARSAAHSSSTGQASALAAGGASGNVSMQQADNRLQQGLAAGPGLISCYEGRLEYWRQLWRTLEMSTVICMIVDARNPLLHFSHALYRHITQDHKLPLVLLLNKCDLLPAAAAAAWQQWLQQQLPGVTVIPVSAAKEQAAATARAVLSAVLQQDVMQGGRRVPVQELVGLSLDELIQESVQRNTHAKRHLEAHQQLQQQDAGEGESDEAAVASSDEEEDWSTKPNRGARKAGRRAGRRKGQQQQQQQMHSSTSDLASLASETDEAAGSDWETPAVAAADGAAGPVLQLGPEQQAINDALEQLTLERRLSSTAARNSSTAHQAAAVTAAAAAAAGAHGRGGAHGRPPVVVGMLGEPNVGKSSTLNALLGTHRVAVSSHPGRTKHYQTHYMCDGLVLVDCPGIVFPRLNVSPAMQVLFGSSPIASCRRPYAVVRYLAEASWPRLQDQLKLHTHLSTLQQQQQQQTMDLSCDAHPAAQQQQQQQSLHPDAGPEMPSSCDGSNESVSAVLQGSTDSSGWSPWTLCEALAVKRHWVLPRSGRLDTYRAANFLLRAALAGQQGVGLAFLPPADGPAAGAGIATAGRS